MLNSQTVSLKGKMVSDTVTEAEISSFHLLWERKDKKEIYTKNIRSQEQFHLVHL